MIVHELNGLVNKFQGLLPFNDNVWDKGQLDFDGTERAGNWNPLRMKVDNARGKRPDIFFASGLIVIPSWSIETLRPFFERSGELLPVYWKRETGFLYNATRVLNCVDKTNSEWFEDEDGPYMIDRPAFHARRVPKTFLFGTPEIPGVFGVSGSPKSPIGKLAEMDLDGVVFIPIWDSDRGLLEYDR